MEIKITKSLKRALAVVMTFVMAVAMCAQGGVSVRAATHQDSGYSAYQGTTYNVEFDVYDDGTAILLDSNNGLISDLIIPSTIDTIYGNGLNSDPTLTGSWTVTTIPANSFNNTTTPANSMSGILSIPSTVTSIGANAFDGNAFSTIHNYSGQSLTIATGVTYYGEDGNAVSSTGGTITVAGGTGVTDDPTHVINYPVNTGLTISATDSTGAANTIGSGNVLTTSYTHTGSAIEPPVTISVGGTTLTAGTDYTVTYSNNTSVGTGTITITGIGTYIGTTTITFTIVDPPADESDNNSNADDSSQDSSTAAAADGSIGTLEEIEADITATSSESDAANSSFAPLLATAKKVKATSIGLVWKKVSGAASYVVYGAPCGKNKYVKVAEVTGTKTTVKAVNGTKIKKGTYYKFIVTAVNSSGNVVSISKIVHAATPGGKFTNAKSVSVAKKKVTLKVKKTFKLNAKVVNADTSLKSKNHRKLSYESTDTSVATVNAKGVIKAVKKGKCTVYAYAQNGVAAAIKVTVK